MTRILRLAIAASLVALAACQSDPTPSNDLRDEPHPNVEDARHLAAEMEALHPDLFHSITEEDFASAVDELVEVAPELSDERFLVEVARLVALPTQEGRDGHAGLFTTLAGVPLNSFPLRVWSFSDGEFVVDATDGNKDLIGAEIVAIEDVPIEEIRALVDPLITRDNPTTVLGRFPPTMLTAELLQGLGVTTGPSASFTFRHDGKEVTRTLDAIPMDSYTSFLGGHFEFVRLPRDRDVLYLRDLKDQAWAEHLPDLDAVYLQYNQVVDPTTVLGEVERIVRKHDPQRVIVDLRHNIGGDNTTYYPLLRFLENGRFSRPGRSFVIAGRTTFSAAGNLAADIEASTEALFVGEPPGGAPNQFGDMQEIVLPNSGITVFVPVYFVEIIPDDERLEIEPDIPAVPSSDDHFKGTDIALDAIARWIQQEG